MTPAMPAKPKNTSALRRRIEVLSTWWCGKVASWLPEGSSRRIWCDRLGGSMVGLVVVVAAIWGVPRLVEHADTVSREQPMGDGGPTVRFAYPEWIPDTEISRLEVAVRSEFADAGVFDRSAIDRAAASLEQSGWFDPGVVVQRVGRNEVRIVSRPRRPVAFVRHGERDHLIDDQTRVLPVAWTAGDAPFVGVVITGTTQPPPEQPGMPWNGTALRQGLAVLALISAKPWCREVSAIDLAEVREGGPITLRTVKGGRIVWGSVEPSAAEVPLKTRVAYLDRLHSVVGSVEPPPGRDLDVRLDYLATTPSRATSPPLASAQR